MVTTQSLSREIFSVLAERGFYTDTSQAAFPVALNYNCVH